MELYFGRSSGSLYDQPDPKPKKNPECNVLSTATYGRYLIVIANYPESKNYEGLKVLVFEDTTLPELEKQGWIDPHFSQHKTKKHPIARFEPTKNGVEMAITLFKTLDKDDE
jgi:hypothetical protein